MDVRPGYRQSEAGVIPEDWSPRQLGEMVTFLDGMRRPVRDSDRAKMRGSIPYYGASGIVDYVNDYLFDDNLILLGEDGENILSRNCRLAFRISGKAWVNNHAHVLKPNPNVSIGFLTDYLESLDYERFNSGTAQPKLNKQTCVRIPIALPPTKAEQEAIAEVLNDADIFIESLEQLLVKKRQLKQGAMQELLTGKKRLPGFSGQWENQELRAVCVKIQDGTHFSPQLGGSDFLYVTSKNIGPGTLDVSSAEKISSAEHAKIYARCDVTKGDLLLTKDGANTGNAALNTLGEPFSLLSSVALLRFDGRKNAAVYFLYQILSPKGQQQIKEMMSGNAITRLTLRKIRSLQFPVAPLPEQTAIAGILSDMDAEIVTLEAKLTKARQIKQGMMQELLTGRIRLV